MSETCISVLWINVNDNDIESEIIDVLKLDDKLKDKWIAFGYHNEFFNVELESPHSPPVKEIKYLSKKFPDIIFTLDYECLGNDFYGMLVLQNGAVKESKAINWRLMKVDDKNTDNFQDESMWDVFHQVLREKPIGFTFTFTSDDVDDENVYICEVYEEKAYT